MLTNPPNHHIKFPAKFSSCTVQGVRLEDKEGTSVVKLIGKEAILKEKEREKQVCNYTTGIGYFIYPFIICAFSCKKRNSNREKIRRKSWKKLG